jgi:hypothetical protein
LPALPIVTNSIWNWLASEPKVIVPAWLGAAKLATVANAPAATLKTLKRVQRP